MTTVSSLGVDQLSLRGSGTDYNILSRFFATKAQADAALADSSWVPTAGKTNGCITGDQGILVYDFGTSALVVADAATRSYVDTEVAAAVAALVDSAPGTLDTLNELAAAINDDANAFTTLQTAIAAVQADVDQNEADADAAIALKADIASPTFTGTPAAPTAGAGTNTTQLATTAFVTAAVAALVDGAPGAIDTLNELAAALNDDASFSTTITNSIAAVQSDVDQNEVDGDAADSALSGRLDVLEADATTGAAVAAVQADVDQNEADADAAIALKANIASPALTGTPTAPTAAADTNTTQIATTAYVQTEVSDLIGDAPVSLNTLGKIADSLNDDINGLTNVTTLVNANETHVDNLATLTGVAKDSVNLGTFTGSTITDSVAIKVALQELETEVETKIAAETLTLTAFQTVVAASSDFADFQSRVAAL